MLSSNFSNFILVAPLCLITIGLCFSLYWFFQRELVYLLWFSVAAMLAGFCLMVLSFIPLTEIHHWAVPLGFIYLATYICLVQAISLRFSTHVSWPLVWLVVIVVQMGIFYYSLIDNQLNMRIVWSGLGFIALCLHKLPDIYRAVARHPIDQALKYVFYFLCAYLLVREVLLLWQLWQGPLKLHYSQTVFWFATQLASLLFLWLFSVLFLVGHIRDRLNVLKTERDIDVLTGLTNRRCFFESAEAFFQTQKVQQHALFLCDLDHFKEINDQHGHQIGDEVLKAFAATVRTVLREQDILARIGGEEFVGVLCQTNLQEALLVIDRISKVLATPLQLESGLSQQVTASFGLVMLSDFNSMEAALKAADALMYQAKAAGRNNVQYVLSS